MKNDEILEITKKFHDTYEKLTKDKLEYLTEYTTMLTSQDKFIKYLEDEIEDCELTSDLIFNHNKEKKIYKEVLQKYKEIIGDDKK